MSVELFREDAYLKQCSATVTSVGENYFTTDQTVFYAQGGGQPGDTGWLTRSDDSSVTICDTRRNRETNELRHYIEAAVFPDIGETVKLAIDWDRRYRIMRLHSCMHMLCAVIPAPVTGGSIRDDGSARLDFDLPDPPDKQTIEQSLNQLTTDDHPMSIQWISDEEMEAQPDLIRTMSVKPPMGQGRVRLVQFSEIDLQPCGGTHVANAREIGAVRVVKIEKKGKLNRRITIALVDKM